MRSAPLKHMIRGYHSDNRQQARSDTSFSELIGSGNPEAHDYAAGLVARPVTVMIESAMDRCRRYRRRILEISQQVEAAHVAPAFSCLEIVDVLYHEVMRPQDIFIMSKGHGCLAQYVVLEDLGVLERIDLDHYCKPCPIGAAGRSLGAHPDYALDLGIHASTGSLGHGLGIAAGQALAEKLKGSDVRVYVLLSDGECQEGSTWEAAMVAANLQLGNLITLVDFNGWGGMNRMRDCFPALLGLDDKFGAFGWANALFDGHMNMEQLVRWLYPDYAVLPRVAVCRTVKGKGVSFIEDGQPLWHYKSPSQEEFIRACQELDAS